MKLPTIYIPEITRDVETDMLVVGTALRQIKGDQPHFYQPQKKQKQLQLTTSSKQNPVITTPKLSRAQISKLITPTSPPSSLPKTSPKQIITPISTERFLSKASYRHQYTPSKLSSLRISTISTPPIPSKPAHMTSRQLPPSRPSTPSASHALSYLHKQLVTQKRHRILFDHLAPQFLRSLITAKTQEEILERRRACEARDRDAWERAVLEEADDREMAIGRKRLRMMSVWLDLKCLVSEGSGFVFEGAEGGEQRDERIREEDGDLEWWSHGGDWRDDLAIESVEAEDCW